MYLTLCAFLFSSSYHLIFWCFLEDFDFLCFLSANARQRVAEFLLLTYTCYKCLPLTED